MFSFFLRFIFSFSSFLKFKIFFINLATPVWAILNIHVFPAPTKTVKHFWVSIKERKFRSIGIRGQ